MFKCSKKGLLTLEEVNNVEVDLKTGRVDLELSKDIDNEVLKKKIEEVGYKINE